MARTMIAGLSALALAAAVGWPSVTAADEERLITATSLEEHPLNLPEDAEFHIVSGYEPDISDGSTVVTVGVHRPGAKVILVLASYDHVLWELTATPPTGLVAVVASRYGGDPQIRTSLDVAVRHLDLPLSQRIDDEDSGRFLRMLRDRLGMDRADSAHFTYTLPDRVAIDRVDSTTPQLDPDWPQPVQANPEVRFFLPAEDGQFQEWTLAGPVDGSVSPPMASQSLVSSPNGQRTFQYVDHEMIVRDLDTGVERTVPMPPGMVSVSGWAGMAYDTRRDQVALVATGAGASRGYLYRFDAVTDQWIDVRDIGWAHDVVGPGYDPISDAYIGLDAMRPDRMALVSIPAEDEKPPDVILELELLGRDRVLEDHHHRLMHTNEFRHVLVDQGHIFLRLGEMPAIWWLPHGATVGQLTYRGKPIPGRQR